MNLYCRILLIAGVTFLGKDCLSQSGQYWTQQYGTESILLGGSVIGGVNDLGAVFYNPGRLARVENPSFMLSAIYESNGIELTDFAGSRVNLRNSDFRFVPNLVAGTFFFDSSSSHRLAYSILTREFSEVELSTRTQTEEEIIAGSPGLESLIVGFDLTNRTRTEWYGLTWSYLISDQWSIGISVYGTRLRESKDNLLKMRLLSDDSNLSAYQFERRFEVRDIGLLSKIGLAYTKDNIQAGITLTTPQFSLLSNGEFDMEESLSGLTGNGNNDYYAFTTQENLNIRNKTPLAVGFGISWLNNNTKLHFSGEWYRGIAEHTVFESEPFQTSLEPIQANTFKFVEHMNNVLNFGIGSEIKFNDKVSSYLSANTDFSAIPNEAPLFIDESTKASSGGLHANLYHFGAGVGLNLQTVRLSMGTTYATGSQDIKRPADFPETGEFESITDIEILDTKINRWIFVLSFSFSFLNF